MHLAILTVVVAQVVAELRKREVPGRGHPCLQLSSQRAAVRQREAVRVDLHVELRVPRPESQTLVRYDLDNVERDAGAERGPVELHATTGSRGAGRAVGLPAREALRQRESTPDCLS